MRRRVALTVLIAAATAALAACAQQPEPSAYGAPGFFWGIAHGLITPFAIIGHVFNHDIRMYAFPNSGGWYDFGFFLGVSALGGGAASGR